MKRFALFLLAREPIDQPTRMVRDSDITRHEFCCLAPKNGFTVLQFMYVHVPNSRVLIGHPKPSQPFGMMMLPQATTAVRLGVIAFDVAFMHACEMCAATLELLDWGDQ